MQRKALVVGINKYDKLDELHYAEKDARGISRRLKHHGDTAAEINFDVKLLLGSEVRITRATLRQAIQDLFADSEGLDLAFYFAGHGHITDISGYLVTADGEHNDYGVTMQDVIDRATVAKPSSVLILLDCCHAGAAVNPPVPHGTGLRDNMTIMAASLPTQSAVETSKEGGLFTSALKDALDGAASDILGEITTASVYSLVERRSSLWKQRPIAKSHVTRRIVLRKTEPHISRQDLRRIVELFPTPDHKYQMNPDHDPERDKNGAAKTKEVPEKIAIGLLFKQYRDASLLCPSVPAENLPIPREHLRHLYYVAQHSMTVELTLFGKEYWRLVKEERV